jgi:nitroimidazol reductase NimA-like FMN-containing flavoprotein (pyridoxamine 5'-phosphate oxidase superfamily)
VTDIPDGPSANLVREVVELDRAEAMRLLASVGYGRVVFTREALPAIRPVNHLVDAGRVIVRTRLVSTVSTVVRSHNSSGVVVAYEADDLDPQQRVGWSVVVTGPGHHRGPASRRERRPVAPQAVTNRRYR